MKSDIFILFMASLLIGTLPYAVRARDSGTPLGDGKISSSPQRGYLYSCQARFNANAGGAHATGDWIVGNNWYPARNPSVDGNVM